MAGESESRVAKKLRVAVLISGGGTTLMNFLQQQKAGRLPIDIPLVIASREDCGGVEKSRRAGLRCEVVARKSYSGVEQFSAEIFRLCREVQADLVALAGFLSLIRIPDDFQHRVLNVHPSLVPAFSGKGFHGHHVHEAVLQRGARVSGCTVHFADNEYDHGPILVQRCVPVLDEDTPDTLAARVFREECEAYPEAIRLFAANRIRLEEGRVRIAAW